MRFEYCDVASLDEAVSLLGQYDNGAHVLAGGADLLPMANEERIRPEYLIDIKPIRGMDQIAWDGRTGLRIGALATIRDMKRSSQVFDRAPAAHLLGVRRRFATAPPWGREPLPGDLCPQVRGSSGGDRNTLGAFHILWVWRPGRGSAGMAQERMRPAIPLG